eukprot:TRINITY_DN856_c0_g4_i1.p1 TRINITY_DN856_c0_g4~~TRINITY_DN856_c0_g4_i1.p1  ORF type:complete len:472 (-),score=44.40 TRINITY_DN856_c0_g4_i1:31-1302(-)
MTGCFGHTTGMMVVVASQIALTFIATGYSEVMRLEWMKFLPENQHSDVMLMKPPQFWGPAISVVPHDCQTNRSATSDEVDRISSKAIDKLKLPEPGGTTRVLDPKTGQMVTVKMQPAGGQHFGLSFEILVAALFPGFASSDGRIDKIGVLKCGELSLYDWPKSWQRYLSMVTFTRLFRVGEPTLPELLSQRLSFRRVIVACIVMTMILKYGVSFIDLLSKFFKQEYVEVWQQSRTRFDRILESSLCHGMTIMFNFVLQITLCTQYMTFWREDHFVMSFVPGAGIVIFLIGVTVLSTLTIVDRLFGIMLRHCSDRHLIVFWILYSVYMLLVTFPMMGYCVFSLNYLYTVNVHGWLHVGGVLTDRFVSAAQKASTICLFSFVVGLMDVALMIRIDMDQHSKIASAEPNRNPLNDEHCKVVGLDVD